MSEENAWIAHGGDVSGQHEDLLIGNRAGFAALTAAIEEALRRGEAPLAQPQIEYVGVRLLDADPRLPARKRPIRELASLVGCALLLVFCGVVFSLGLFTLAGFFR